MYSQLGCPGLYPLHNHKNCEKEYLDTYTSPDASTFDPVGKFILPALAGLDGPLVMVNPGLLLRLAKALLPDLTLEVFITDRDGGKGSLLVGEGRGGIPRGGC